MFCLDWKEIMKKKNFLHFKYILFLFLLFIDFAFFIFSFYELEVMCELGKKFSPSHSTPLGMKIRQFSMYIYCSTIFRKFPRDEKKKKQINFVDSRQKRIYVFGSPVKMYQLTPPLYVYNSARFISLLVTLHILFFFFFIYSLPAPDFVSPKTSFRTNAHVE